jgi:hypothetical protein
MFKIKRLQWPSPLSLLVALSKLSQVTTRQMKFTKRTEILMEKSPRRLNIKSHVSIQCIWQNNSSLTVPLIFSLDFALIHLIFFIALPPVEPLAQGPPTYANLVKSGPTSATGHSLVVSKPPSATTAAGTAGGLTSGSSSVAGGPTSSREFKDSNSGYGGQGLNHGSGKFQRNRQGKTLQTIPYL